MRWYLAAQFARQEEMRRKAAQLQESGQEVTSRWIYSGGAVRDMTDEERENQAISHMEDIVKSDGIIIFTKDDEGAYPSLGGRHVEFGAGLGTNKTMVVVGPRENIFHWLPNVQVFETFEAFLATLSQPFTE